jgi:drug/metabolite transporter (DMT)-like permease
MGVVGYSLSTYFTTLGVLHTSLVNVSIIGNTEPFFVYLYSLLVFKQPLKTQVLLFIFLSILGVAMVATHSFVPVVSAIGIGEVYVVLFAATSAWYLIGRKLLSDKLNNSEITVLGMAIACLSTFVLALFARESFTPQHLLFPGVFVGLLLGGALNTIVMLLQNLAYKHLEGVVASQILLLATLFSLLYGYLWYREMVSLPQMVGVVVILASVFMTNKLVTP